MKRNLTFLFLFICLLGKSQSRQFVALTSSDGISQSEVYSFLEDSKGYMWFGTVDGLNRYDGYNIQIFNVDRHTPHSLSNNTIRALAEDRFGLIWIGTDDGLNFYDMQSEQITQVTINESDNKSPIWSLCVYGDYLFVGRLDGVWVTKIERKQRDSDKYLFSKVGCVNNNLSDKNLIRVITKSNFGGVWILGANNISRIIIDKNDIKLVEVIPFEKSTIPNYIIEDFTGNLWIASEYHGISRYNIKTKQRHAFTDYRTPYAPCSNKCSSLTLDKNGNLWIGSLDSGLNFVKAVNLNNDKVFFEHIQYDPLNSKGINSNLIYSLYVASNNQLWIGTIGSGVNIYDPQQKKFKHYKVRELNKELTNSNFIRAVYADKNNRIWAGTQANGLILFDRGKDKFQILGFNTQSIFHIAPYKDDKVLICGSSGVYLVEFRNGKMKILSRTEPCPVFYIEKGLDNVYWSATLHGLERLKIINDKIVFDKRYTTKTTPGISADNCGVLFYNKSDNELYVGTEGGGLNIVSFDNEHLPTDVTVYKESQHSNTISSNYVRAITKDSEQNIWVGTYNGLNKIIVNAQTKERSFKAYTKRDGLPNNMIQFIISNDSNLWVGTNKGLSQFIPSEDKFYNYTEQDGLQGNEFSEHTAYKSHDGEIIIGGINGINVFYPTQIEVSSVAPRTIVTDFFLNNEKITPEMQVNGDAVLNKSIVFTDHITLSPKQKQIGFKFSAMIFPNAEKIKYAYMLEGFDDDWQYTNTGNRIANYTNLRHGKYTFKVKSTNADGVWEPTAREIAIHIKTPLGYTWFAFILYGVIIVLTIKYFLQYIIDIKRLSLEKKHSDKLRQLDMLRIKFFINISHDLRTPLTLIREPLDVVLQNSQLSIDVRQKLELIKRNVKRLSYLVEQLLDIRKAETSILKAKLNFEDIVSFSQNEISLFNYAINKKGLTVKLTSTPEVVYASFDKRMLSKVYFNILSNAIKFTSYGGLEIDIERVPKDSYSILKASHYDSFVKVEIRDTGIGISDEQRDKIFERFYQVEGQTGKGYGIGLSHTKELIDAHNGFIEVESHPNVGTTIRFFIPDNEIVDTKSIITTEAHEDMYIDEEPLVVDGEYKINNKQNTILIVEDNIDLRNFIKGELMMTYNVIEACDGLDGYEKALEHLPDLIVSDIVMPKMNGVDLCLKIKSNTVTSHIPFILLTAIVDLETKYEGIRTGADDYIPKPFEMEYLLLRIKNILDAKETMRKMFQKNQTLSPADIAVTSLDEVFLTSLMEQIGKGISDSEFSISSLESKMAMSHAQFYRKIKSLTGQSGKELLYSIRMKRAYQILSEGKGVRVSDVTYMVGFTNPKYFSKCFKEFYSVSPTQVSTSCKTEIEDDVVE